MISLNFKQACIDYPQYKAFLLALEKNIQEKRYIDTKSAKEKIDQLFKEKREEAR